MKLGLPVLIKPNQNGSSIGITIVFSIEKLFDAIKIALNYDNNILIEKFIPGKEYTVSILGEQVLPSIHISTKNTFYDYHAKYISSSTQYLCPSGLHITQEKKIKKIALKAWKILGGSGCGRIDFILDNENKFWLLEINTIPGMTTRSLTPIAAQALGISFDELVLSILNMSNKYFK